MLQIFYLFKLIDDCASDLFRQTIFTETKMKINTWFYITGTILQGKFQGINRGACLQIFHFKYLKLFYFEDLN